MDRTPRLSTVVFGLVAAIWALIVFGASVRVHGAGLACPDWPLCFGRVVPEIDFGVFFEFGHRVYAGVISLVFLGVGAALFARGAPGSAKGIWGVGLAVLGVQIVLGGLTVLELLAEWTVTSHLLAGNAFCALVLLLALAVRAHEDGGLALEATSLGQRFAVVSFAGGFVGQLALGGLVSSSHAGLVCPDWPTCAGSVWVPTLGGLVGLQVVHRFLAYGLAFLALGVFAASAGHRHLRAPAGLLVALVCLQIALGVGNVLLRLPLEVTLAHSGIAAAIGLTTTWLGWRALRAPLALGAPAVDAVRA